MIRQITALALAALTVIALSATAASAHYGDDFDVVQVNVDGAQSAPAFPGTRAAWAGTCDLRSAATEDGGTGTSPSDPSHCIDTGTVNLVSPRINNWTESGTPSWRLDPVADAGAHPDGTASFTFKRSELGLSDATSQPSGNARQIVVDLPPGVVGNPTAVPFCPSELLRFVPTKCPPQSQVGIATAVLTNSIDLLDTAAVTVPIYNAEPRDGEAAEFMLSGVFELANVPLHGVVRSEDDFGIRTFALELPAGLPVHANTLTFWGTPWSSSHDHLRVPVGTAHIEPGVTPQPYEPSWGSIKPFFTNPTRCQTDAPVTLLRANSWQNSERWIKHELLADSAVKRCDLPAFKPGIEVKADSARADSPGDFEVDLRVPQNNEPPAAIAQNPDDETGAPLHWDSSAGRATAHLKDTVVWMPEGVSINPSAADGLAAVAGTGAEQQRDGSGSDETEGIDRRGELSFIHRHLPFRRIRARPAGLPGTRLHRREYRRPLPPRPGSRNKQRQPREGRRSGGTGETRRR